MLQRDFFTNFTNSHFLIVQSLPHSILEALLCGVTRVADRAHHETLISCWSRGERVLCRFGTKLYCLASLGFGSS